MAWNRGVGGTTPVKAKKPSSVRGLVAGALVCVLAAGAYLAFFAGSEGSRKVETQDAGGRIRDVGRRGSSTSADAAAVKVPVVPQQEYARQHQVIDASTIGKVQKVETTGASTETAEEKVEEPKKKPVFENGTDQLIAMATGVPEGCTIPPLPNMTPADTDRFIETLKQPIKIDEDDSEAVKAAKERVQQVREQIVEWMKEEPGKELGAILNEHRDEFNHATEMQSEVKKGLQEYLDANDTEGAKKYLTMMNLALQQVGIPEVEMPKDEEESENEGETTNE